MFQIQELEQDKRDLERQVNDLKNKCEQIEKRAGEQRAVEEKKHTEEIQFLKRTNQQLKVGHEAIHSRVFLGGGCLYIDPPQRNIYTYILDLKMIKQFKEN